MNRSLGLAIAATVSVVALTTATGGSAAPPDATAPARATQAEALTRAAAVDRAHSPSVAADGARAVADGRNAAVPLPTGGTFSGVRWELAGGTLSDAEIEGVLEYNAECQWLRAWRDGREADLAAHILPLVPQWPALRDTEAGGVLAKVAADVGAGGGQTADGVLADCDASHAREVSYAKQLGLTPSS